MNSPITGKPMDLVSRSETIITYKGFNFFVESDAYYCEVSDSYFTDDVIDKRTSETLESMWLQVQNIRQELGTGIPEIQKIYNMTKSFALKKFKKYYTAYGSKV